MFRFLLIHQSDTNPTKYAAGAMFLVGTMCAIMFHVSKPFWSVSWPTRLRFMVVPVLAIVTFVCAELEYKHIRASPMWLTPILFVALSAFHRDKSKDTPEESSEDIPLLA